MEDLAAELRHILTHSLGLTNSHKPYRRHFAASNGTRDFELCRQLEAMGFMEQGAPLPYGLHFLVTEAGARAVGATLPKD